MKRDELDNVLAMMEDLDKTTKFNRIVLFQPYPKQQEFLSLGATMRERLLKAGNQQGKSECGAFEMACHLTGKYPKGWNGRKWRRPIRAWAAGESSVVVRDVQQKKLCGQPGVIVALGTGMIPKECFADTPSMARGVTDAYDTIQVKHYTDGVMDGISTLTFKSYEQGRQKFQGEPVDLIWGDEEPPMDVYSEMLTRTTATGGMVYITFTPLKGMSAVVQRFLNEPSPDRAVVTMTLNDALHIPESERAKIIAGYPSHERDARVNGVPMLGSGRIFPYDESAIAEDQLSYIPPHWTKLWSIDFGINHPFAAVLMIWDRDNDVLHVHHAIRMKSTDVRVIGPQQHAAAMKPIGAAIPVAWPHDGTKHEHGTGETISTQYKQQGLLMLPEHATWPDGGISTEAGVLEMQDRMTTGRLKVARHLSEWFDEFRHYHRKDGQINKIMDDLLSATRIGVMAKRYGRMVQLGGKSLDRSRRRNNIADGVDFDPF